MKKGKAQDGARRAYENQPAHAAVSATYALANALAGRAVEAASYAAYASVYAYGGYAVADRSAFEPELTWQLEELRRLAALQEQGRARRHGQRTAISRP